MEQRRTYLFPKIVLNGRKVTQVVVDPHYELKHQDIDDALILDLVSMRDDGDFIGVINCFRR